MILETELDNKLSIVINDKESNKCSSWSTKIGINTKIIDRDIEFFENGLDICSIQHYSYLMYNVELTNPERFNVSIKYNDDSYDTDSISQLIGLTGREDSRELQEIVHSCGLLARHYMGEPRRLQRVKVMNILEDRDIRVQAILIKSEYNDLDLLKIEICDKRSGVNHSY